MRWKDVTLASQFAPFVTANDSCRIECTLTPQLKLSAVGFACFVVMQKVGVEGAEKGKNCQSYAIAS